MELKKTRNTKHAGIEIEVRINGGGVLITNYLFLDRLIETKSSKANKENIITALKIAVKQQVQGQLKQESFLLFQLDATDKLHRPRDTCHPIYNKQSFHRRLHKRNIRIALKPFWQVSDVISLSRMSAPSNEYLI